MQNGSALDSQLVYRVPVQPRAQPRREIALSLFWVSMILILAANLTLCAWRLGETDFWTDEVLTALRVRVPLNEAFDSILRAGNQAPLYYLLLRVMPESNELWLRIPSVFFGQIGILLVMLMFSGLYRDRVFGLQAGALMAVNPFYIMLARTARLYTLLFVLALAMTLCFILILRGQRSRTMWVSFGLISTTAYLTHLSALIIAGSQFFLLVILWKWDRQPVRPVINRWLAVQGLAVLPTLLWMLLSLVYEGTNNVFYVPPGPTLGDLPVTSTNMLLGYTGGGQWYALPGILAGMIGLLAGITFTAREQHDNPEHFHWLIVGTLPTLLMFAVAVIVFPKYRDRYVFVSIPAVIWLFLYGGSRLPRLWGQVAFIVVVMTGFVLTIDLYHSGAYQREAWQDAADYIAREYQPGDVILFPYNMMGQAFTEYYDGDPALLENSAVHNDISSTAAFERGATRIWAVYRIPHEDRHRQGWMTGFGPLDVNVSPLSDWLRARWDRIISRVEFDGIVLFVLTPPG